MVLQARTPGVSPYIFPTVFLKHSDNSTFGMIENVGAQIFKFLQCKINNWYHKKGNKTSEKLGKVLATPIYNSQNFLNT